MENNLYRVAIEATVRKAITDIKDDSGRGIRNLVDMALQLANKRFLKEFLQNAQGILQNENSAYYALASDVARHVDERYLMHFGINVGYNSCVLGAQKIRKKEAELSCNIPWQVSLLVSAKSLAQNMDEYERIIEEGNSLGIYCWYIFEHDCLQACIPLIGNHTNNAFVVFCHPDEITPSSLEKLAGVPHAMPVVYYESGVDEACALLRSKSMLSSVAYSYQASDMHSIHDGALLSDLESLRPVFTALIPALTCTADVLKAIAQKVVELRVAQLHQTIFFDLYGDSRTIDSIISEDFCSLAFDENGHVILFEPNEQKENLNLFTNSLEDIFCALFPKKQDP